MNCLRNLSTYQLKVSAVWYVCVYVQITVAVHELTVGHLSTVCIDLVFQKDYATAICNYLTIYLVHMKL